MPTRADHGRITLHIPADPSYVSTARAFASSVARREGCGPGDVEDLKVGVSEAASLAIEAHAGGIDIAMSVGVDHLLVGVSGIGGDGTERSAPGVGQGEDMRRALIEALFDDTAIEVAGPANVRFSLPLRGENAGDEDVRCPVCGQGLLIDISFSDATADGTGPLQQVPESSQVETFSCGHERVGPSLSKSVSSDVPLDAERRTSEETTERPRNAP